MTRTVPLSLCNPSSIASQGLTASADHTKRILSLRSRYIEDHIAAKYSIVHRAVIPVVIIVYHPAESSSASRAWHLLLFRAGVWLLPAIVDPPGHKRSSHALRWKTRLHKNPFSITPEKLRVTPQRLQRRYHRHLLLAAVKM
jgi:hypothetical protein